MTTEVKFDWIGKGFEIYKQNLGTLLVASLIAVVLSAFTFGILAGPMFAGMILIVLDLIDGKEKKPDVGRLFNGFNHFAQSLLFMLVWGLITFAGSFVLSFILCVGQIAAVFGSLVLNGLLMFGLFLIVDKGMEFWPASMESMKVVKTQFWPLVGYYIVASVLGGLGSVACGIGIFLTLPIMICSVAVAYREFFPVQGAPQPEPEAAPATEPTTPESQPAA